MQLLSVGVVDRCGRETRAGELYCYLISKVHFIEKLTHYHKHAIPVIQPEQYIFTVIPFDVSSSGQKLL